MTKKYKLLAMYHPAASLHNPRLWSTLLDDWEHLPEQVPYDFTIAESRPRHFEGTYAVDTENAPDGSLGNWSVAQRNDAGEIIVTPYYRRQEGIQFGGEAILQNAKWDVRVLRANKMPEPTNIQDTMIAAYCLGLGRQDVKDNDERNADNMVGGLGLKYLARRHLGIPMRAWEEVKDHPELIPEYNAMDSVATLLLWEKFKPQLPKHYFDIDMPLLPVLMAMEDRGVRVDPNFLREYANSLDAQLKELSSRLPINAFSPEQVSTYIYGVLGVEPFKFTETGAPSVSSDVLETIDDPIVKQILEYKTLYKERGTYVGAYVNNIGLDGRIHCEFKQTRTATGRLSAARPNLQNVTKSGILRSLFIAPPGKLLVRIDWKQLELLVFAIIANDERMLAAFREGRDIHAETMVALGLTERRAAKVFNFQTIYGGEAWKFSQEYHIPINEARKLMDKYFEQFPGVKRYFDRQKALAYEAKEVTNYFGRRRRLDSMFAEDWRVRQDGEREAINTPIQGTAAEIVKLAMIDLHQKHNAPMLLAVHDELLFEVDEKEAPEYARWLEGYVPKITIIDGWEFPVEVSYGRTWAETTEEKEKK